MKDELIKLVSEVTTPFWAGVIGTHLADNDVTIPVRCRDCKHFTEGMAVGMCKRIPDKPIMPMPYNAYCSFGERRAEDGK